MPPTDPPADVEPPVLPDVTRDEDEPGWGDHEDLHDRDEWYRRERPPHHE
jgi:hypothetical protein